MAATRIEGFVLDRSFVNRQQNTHLLLDQAQNKVGTMTQHGASYFVTPEEVIDKRTASTRAVAWQASVSSSIVFDSTVFAALSTLLTSVPEASVNAIFDIVDRIGFNLSSSDTVQTVDGALTSDKVANTVYIPGTCQWSTKLLSTTVYNDDGTTKVVSVPAWIEFGVSLTGSTSSAQYTLVLYLSNDDWIADYTQSTIVTVIPPLPYDTLFNAPIATSVANVFSTANITASLSMATSQLPLSQQFMSGMAEFYVTLTDGTTSTQVPFNLYYRGRSPAITDIRIAIRDAIAQSGVGTLSAWKTRAPNIYITSRFYLLPMYSKVVSKPAATMYENIIQLSDVSKLISTSFAAVGLDINLTDMAILEASYNRLMLLAIPDVATIPDASVTPITRLLDIFTDYQTCSTTDPSFVLLTSDTQSMISQLNMILAQEMGASQTTTPYAKTTEGSMEYYAFTVAETELCVATQACMATLENPDT